MEINIPGWAQEITVFGVMIASVIVGVWRYFKTETDKISKKDTTHEPIVAAASFIDTKLIRELIDTLREHQEEIGRQSQRITRSQGELRETIIELIEGVHMNTNTSQNMLRFLIKRTNIGPEIDNI